MFQFPRLQTAEAVAIAIEPAEQNGAVVNLQPAFIERFETERFMAKYFTDEGSFSSPSDASLLGDAPHFELIGIFQFGHAARISARTGGLITGCRRQIAQRLVGSVLVKLTAE